MTIPYLGPRSKKVDVDYCVRKIRTCATLAKQIRAGDLKRPSTNKDAYTVITAWSRRCEEEAGIAGLDYLIDNVRFDAHGNECLENTPMLETLKARLNYLKHPKPINPPKVTSTVAAQAIRREVIPESKEPKISTYVGLIETAKSLALTEDINNIRQARYYCLAAIEGAKTIEEKDAIGVITSALDIKINRLARENNGSDAY